MGSEDRSENFLECVLARKRKSGPSRCLGGKVGGVSLVWDLE